MTCLSSELLDAINEFEKTTQTLFRSLHASRSGGTLKPSSTQPAPSSIDKIFRALEDCDVKLSRVAAKIPQHQANQAMIEDYMSRIKSYDETWRNDLETASWQSQELQDLVDQGMADQKRIHQSRAEHITPTAILNLGRQLAPFTSAPPTQMGPDTKLLPPDLRELVLRGGVPPFPTEDVMRRGVLGSQEEEGEQAAAQVDGQTGTGQGEIDYAQLMERQRRKEEASYLAQQQAAAQNDHADDDAFDLDLNPDL